MINVAFIGCGRIADLHILGYQNNKDAKVVALAISPDDKELGERRRQEWGVERVVDDWRVLLDDDGIDMVEILTPHHLHETIAVAFLEAGKHVSLQKPITNTMAEAYRIRDAVKNSKAQFRVFENYRFFPPIMKAREIMNSGELGEFVQIKQNMYGGTGGWHVPNTAWKWRYNPSLSGGGSLVYDHGYHVYSLAEYFGGEVEKVYAWIGESHEAYKPGPYDNPVMAMWKYKGEGKKYGTWQSANTKMDFNSKYYGSDDPVEVVCEKGIIQISTFCSEMRHTAPLTVLYEDGTEKHYHHLLHDWADSFISCSRHFVECLKEGRQADLDIDRAIQIQKMGVAVLQSSLNEREIFIDEVVENSPDASETSK